MPPWLRLKFFPNPVPHIRRELRRETNLDMTVLRHLLDADDTQGCVMEVQSEVAGPPEECLWLDSLEGVGAEWANERSRRAWPAWSAALAGDDSPALAPWERAGWFGDAKLWMQARLHEAGYELKGPVDQLSSEFWLCRSLYPSMKRSRATATSLTSALPSPGAQARLPISRRR